MIHSAEWNGAVFLDPEFTVVLGCIAVHASPANPYFD